MSYLLDKKIKRKKFLISLFFSLVFLMLFYFRLNIWSGFSYISHKVFRPVLVAGHYVGDKLQGLSLSLVSKNSLYLENKNLRSQLEENRVKMFSYDYLLSENIDLKEILGRYEHKKSMVLAAILTKPNQSLYDTLIIDVGLEEGLKVGDLVFALGNIPIGRLKTVYQNSAKVVLFTTAGEKTQAAVSPKTIQLNGSFHRDVFMEITGRGGGNFEMLLPRDFALTEGDVVVWPGLTPYVLATVRVIISDPRDSSIKALLISPVNVQELKFVEVETQS